MCVRAVCVSRTPEITYRKGLQAASSQRTERIKCNGGKKNRTKIRFQVFFVCGDIKYIKKTTIILPGQMYASCIRSVCVYTMPNGPRQGFFCRHLHSTRSYPTESFEDFYSSNVRQQYLLDLLSILW